MGTLKARELAGLRRELDIFETPAPISPRLLRSGLYPPLPVSGQFLIWGFHLMAAATAAGLEGLHYQRLDPLPVAEMLRIALELEGRPGGYSWPERERIFRLLEEAERPAGVQGELPELSAWIEGRPDPHWAEKLRRYGQLKAALKRLLVQKLVDLKTALRVDGLPEAVFELLAARKEVLTFSQRRLFLEYFYEVSLREKMSPQEVIALSKEVLAGEAPLKQITRRRYPRLSKLEERFHALVEANLKGSGIRLQAPPHFEGASFSLSFSFSSKRGLSRKLGSLKALAEKSDELFSLTH